MKTGTKVLIGAGVAGAAFAICCKWGPCCDCFGNNMITNGGGDVYVTPQIPPTDNIEASGPVTPSPTDFDAVRANVPSVVSFKPPADYILE